MTRRAFMFLKIIRRQRWVNSDSRSKWNSYYIWSPFREYFGNLSFVRLLRISSTSSGIFPYQSWMSQVSMKSWKVTDEDRSRFEHPNVIIKSTDFERSRHIWKRRIIWADEARVFIQYLFRKFQKCISTWCIYNFHDYLNFQTVTWIWNDLEISILFIIFGFHYCIIMK